MSAETKTALQVAIENHVRDETSEYVGAWILVTATTSLDDLDRDEDGMYIEAAGNAYTHTGLLYEAIHADRAERPSDD